MINKITYPNITQVNPMTSKKVNPKDKEGKENAKDSSKNKYLKKQPKQSNLTESQINCYVEELNNCQAFIEKSLFLEKEDRSYVLFKLKPLKKILKKVNEATIEEWHEHKDSDLDFESGIGILVNICY